MSRLYYVPFENVAVSATQDAFELTAAANKPIGIVGVFIDNVGGTADAGDAQEEFWRASIVRGHTTSGSGGSTVTPVPADPSDGAAGFTVEINNTTIASAGTAVTGPVFNVGSRSGADFPLLPTDYAFRTINGLLLVVRFLSAPADSINLSGTLLVVEF